jgi:hypothetical protein
MKVKQSRKNFISDISKCTLGLSALVGLGCRSHAMNESSLNKGFLHHKPKVKNVIYLHMAGSPPNLDLFDYKPELLKFNGKNCPDEFTKGKRFAFTSGTPKLLGTPRKFQQYGQSGIWMSDALKHLPAIADDLTFIHSMHTEEFNHAPAQLLMQTGFSRHGRPSLGSWVNYGLGSQNPDLPGYFVMVSGGKSPAAGKGIWSAGFLPSHFQGVRCQSTGSPILYVNNPTGINHDLRGLSIKAIKELNMIQYSKFKNPETLTRSMQYELAYKMQKSIPEIMNIEKEKNSTIERYGAEIRKGGFANNCLLARKLVENGVRFVQLYDWGWDFHGVKASEDIRDGLTAKCQNMDKPVVALIQDLKERGLFDETLVIWGGEFGRTPFREGRTSRGNILGRDHYPDCFTIFMAGGGLKPGLSYGKTDELGFNIAENKVHVHDFQATVLHLLGIDHTKLTYKFQGRDYRLTDVHGNIINGILA